MLYGSFNRPLDYLYPGDLAQEFTVTHVPWPLKPGQPHSILAVEQPLTEDEIYRYELRRMLDPVE